MTREPSPVQRPERVKPRQERPGHRRGRRHRAARVAGPGPRIRRFSRPVCETGENQPVDHATSTEGDGHPVFLGDHARDVHRKTTEGVVKTCRDPGGASPSARRRAAAARRSAPGRVGSPAIPISFQSGGGPLVGSPPGLRNERPLRPPSRFDNQAEQRSGGLEEPAGAGGPRPMRRTREIAHLTLVARVSISDANGR